MYEFNALVSAPLTDVEQASLWRQLFQHSPGGIVGLEAVRDQTDTIIDFRYQFINEVALNDLFSTQTDQRHDVTAQLVSTYFPSIRQSPLWPVYLDVMARQQARQITDAPLVYKSDFRALLYVSPFSKGILISYTEVTNNQLHTHAIEQQSVRLSNILNSSPNAIVVFDLIRDAGGRPADFRVSMVNRLFEVMAGQQANYFVGMPLHSFYPIEADQLANLFRLMETGEPIRREEYVASHNLWLDLVLTRIDNGFIATLHDITSEKQTLDQLEQQAQLLEGLMNTVQNGLAVMEAIRDEAGRLVDYRYVEASQSLLTGLKLTREQVIGQRLLTVLPSLRDTTIWPLYLRVLETGVPHQFENQFKTDQFDLHFAMSVAKLNDGLVVSYTNISEAKLAQNQLEALVLELRRSNESLDQFAYVASHDLQEPLRKIVSFGDILQQQVSSGLSDETIDMIQRMQQAAGRMRTLVQDLLAYARLTTHPAQFEAIPLDQIVATSLSQFADIIQESKAQFTSNALPTVLGDHHLLNQLFQNLIGNSLKFHQPGQPPRIALTGRFISAPDALPGQSQCVEITITDNGIGFDEKYLDRIFTVFQRLHSQQQYPGTGIGLAICQKVVDLHGGTIAARSQPELGTTFIVRLPTIQSL